jgi:hypothetical protein
MGFSTWPIFQKLMVFGLPSLIETESDDSPFYVNLESEQYDPKWDDIEPALYDWEAEGIYEPWEEAQIIPFPTRD